MELTFKTDEAWINLFVGGKIYPVQLKTLLNPSTHGSYFRDRIRNDDVIKVHCVQWDNSPNHIKNRMDIDRDGELFRQVLQFMRNGKGTSLPEDRFTLQSLLSEAEFFGLERYRDMIRKRLWKMTGRAQFLLVLLRFGMTRQRA
ncbi:unnamed protein product [Caenorhabditis auriculariae]|uniref:BTB domain-containing protein n=1 Tax=Caenorhabditis auriculariae TaxID=2777116 RepID=A0A8S1HUI4_9PELO|nr:unnamed protein product [Caenorhabditis auriculariae]